jgi:MFS family permease
MNKIRAYLFAGSAFTIILVAVFLWVLNFNEPSEYTSVPFSILIVLTAIAVLAMAIFCAKGPVFNIEGQLEAANINAMLITVLVIIQVAFFFEILSVRNQMINYQTYTEIRNNITRIEKISEDELDRSLPHLLNDTITDIMILDEDMNVVHSSDASLIGTKATYDVYDEHTYPFSKGRRISFIVNYDHNISVIKSIALNLITVLITSVFFSVEMVLLILQIIKRNMQKSFKQEVSSETKADDSDGMISSLYYIRQISFLFYFASRLSSAFIPTMAKELINPISFISANAAAGLPQSAETLLTCSAIFITTIILEKKGWKLPFISGLILVALGTFLSAISGNLLMFILSRAVVGLGYGLCWMTLRNLSLFGKDSKQQLLGFALLNAGIYAGMNCGSALGAILADIFGYRIVFYISAVLTITTSLFIIRLENAVLPHKEADISDTSKEVPLGFTDKLQAIIFVILMIAPASIAASYLSYYLPLYFQSIGGSTTDVGRAQLIYGMIIVYAGPLLSVLLTGNGRSLKKINVVYSVMIAISLFLPGIGSGFILAFAGAGLLGLADSFGFGVQNNYYLDLPAIKKLGASKSLSVLSFTKKMLEMIGPFVFAFAIVIGYQAGIRVLGIIFLCAAIMFMIIGNVSSANRR